MKMTDQPFFTRPGYKLYTNGAQSLDTAELLAILLGKGRRGESVLELSHKLLKDYNLRGLETLVIFILSSFLDFQWLLIRPYYSTIL